MWITDYSLRLQDWNILRSSCRQKNIEFALASINDWWWQAPMINHWLHWDYHDQWPDPWELIHADSFCDLARGLGMSYTVMMLDHPQVLQLNLIFTGSDNLVQINDGKYILNWIPGDIVNIGSSAMTIKRSLPSQALLTKLGS
jgi:hypothetical protein